MKKIKNVTIRKASLDDVSFIKIIMDDTFGAYAQNEELFKKWISQEEFSVYVAVDGNRIIGVSTWNVRSNLDLSKYAMFGADAVNFMKDSKLVSFLNLVVLPEYRQKGLGKKLSLAHFEWLKSQKCDAVFGTSWVNGSDENSSHLYIKAGFKELGKSKEFLRSQLQGSGNMCSVCKTQDCECTSLFFGISVNDLINNEKHFYE